MRGKIYLIEDGDTLHPLTEHTYSSENLLQKLLAAYPDVLAGEQIDVTAPRRWLLISREYGIPDEEDTADRWSLDHLFLDQDGIPTLVEVKRSSDTRSRRRVVAQMLDYAANAVCYWPLKEIRTQYRTTCEQRGQNPEEQLAVLLNAAPDDESTRISFWQGVKSNLKAGRIRMIFVADKIPSELRRIVEFLNEQMDPAEVLAVEVKQYVGDGLRTLVPTVVSQTAEAQQKKSAGTPPTAWNESKFFSELRKRYGSQSTKAARKIYNWAQEKGCEIDWRRGNSLGGFIVRFALGDTQYGLFKVEIDNNLAAFVDHYNEADIFTAGGQWKTLREKMNALGLSFPEHPQKSKHLRIPLSDLHDQKLFERFKHAFGWVIKQITSASPDPVQ